VAGLFSFSSAGALGVHCGTDKRQAGDSGNPGAEKKPRSDQHRAEGQYAFERGEHVLKYGAKNENNMVIIGKRAGMVYQADDKVLVYETAKGGKRVYHKEEAVKIWKTVSPSTFPDNLNKVCWGALFNSDNGQAGLGFLASCLEIKGPNSSGHKCGAGQGHHNLPLELRKAMQKAPVLTFEEGSDTQDKGTAGGRGTGGKGGGRGRGRH
jgi:hypothetical protein